MSENKKELFNKLSRTLQDQSDELRAEVTQIAALIFEEGQKSGADLEREIIRNARLL